MDELDSGGKLEGTAGLERYLAAAAAGQRRASSAGALLSQRLAVHASMQNAAVQMAASGGLHSMPMQMQSGMPGSMGNASSSLPGTGYVSMPCALKVRARTY